MTEPVINIGDKLYIMTRRLFENDLRRHFAGEFIGLTRDLIEVRGYAFVFNAGTNNYLKLPEHRTRAFSPGPAGLIVNKIPRDVAIQALEYRLVDRRLAVSDGYGFALDVNEFGVTA